MPDPPDSAPGSLAREELASIVPGRSLSDIAHLGVMSLGLLYAVGLLIVNLDLARYGLVSLDLARPEYLITGGLYALLCGLPLVAWDIAALKHRTETANAGLPVKIVFGLASGVIMLLLPMMLLGVLGYRAMNEPEPSKGLLGLLGGAFIIWINALALSGLWTEMRGWHPREGSFLDFVLRAVPRALVGGVFVLIVGLSLYVIVVFPKLPRQVGGGGKPIVRLVLNELPPVAWHELTILSSAVEKTVGPVALLLESGTQYVVAPIDKERTTMSGRGAVAIDKKVVTAVVYAKPESMPLGFLLDLARKSNQTAPVEKHGK